MKHDGRLQERRSHALTAGVERDHQADVGDMRARRMGITPDREPSDERAVVTLGDQDGRVRVPPQRLEEAALVAGAPPLARDADQPAFRLGAYRFGQPGQLLGV